jgi:hypothetical protein
MTTEVRYKPAGKTVAYGAIAGFISALVMAPLLMATALISGMPSNAIPMAIGIMFGASSPDVL